MKQNRVFELLWNIYYPTDEHLNASDYSTIRFTAAALFLKLIHSPHIYHYGPPLKSFTDEPQQTIKEKKPKHINKTILIPYAFIA